MSDKSRLDEDAAQSEFNFLERSREQRLRRMAKRQGLTLQKSATRDPLALSYGAWYLHDQTHGDRLGREWSGYEVLEFHALDAVESFLKTPVGQRTDWAADEDDDATD